MTTKLKNGWKKYSTTKMVFPYANCFYQKWIFDKITATAEIKEYNWESKKSWTLCIQIPEGESITKMTINAECFSYTKLDFDKIEKDARKIIKNLANKH